MNARIAAGFIGLLSSLPALAAPPDALQQVQNLLPSAKVEAISAGKWTIVEDFVPPSGARTQPARTRDAEVITAIACNGNVLLEELSGRCLWGGRDGPMQVHASLSFGSFDKFIAENSYAPLPKVPDGFSIRQLTAMPEAPVRIACDPSNKRLLVLSLSGNIYEIALPAGNPKMILSPDKFAEAGGGQFLGITFARDGRLYLVGNRFDFSMTPAMNHATVYRTSKGTLDPKPWASADIPFAIDVFQHSVSYVAEGPDGKIYVSSGSRTDHGEAGNNPKRSKEGETPLSSCIWQLDPLSDHPKIEIFARGLRNAFGFCWDDRGRMFATENGPNADPPEEINLVERGKHYGFPFQFSDMTTKAYPDQPDAPPGLKIEPPLAKLDPHSSPSGIVFWNAELLVARFGNLIGLKDVGFDILKVGRDGSVHPFIAPIARPTDMQLAGGKVYVCEYQRQTRNAGGDFPGRILEISLPAEINGPRRD